MSWRLVFEGWDHRRQPLREALCTLGNGYVATRGAFEEADAGGAHYPGTYLAGGFDRAASRVLGREVVNEDLVNWPNWLLLSFRPPGGPWFDPATCELVELRVELDLQRGVLQRTARVRDGDGRETDLVARRWVHMADPHLAGIHWSLTPRNWSGRLQVRSGLDGSVRNTGVARYNDLRRQHLVPLATGHDGDEIVSLHVRTIQSRLRMAQAARTRVRAGGGRLPDTRDVEIGPDRVAQVVALDVDEGEPVEVEKLVSIHTSRDRAVSEELGAALQDVARAPRFDELLLSHAQAWASLWRRCDVELDGHPEQQRTLRVHVFHLLQTVSHHGVGLDVGVPARGLHGEAYRGHVFWDELFIFPFLDQSLPELTRSLLLYRVRRLPAARWNAKEQGLRGALYPWQSGSDGREESQRVHLNPRSGRWLPDDTHLQRHVNGAVAYNIWSHVHTTHDREFLAYYGAEVFLEIARMWASLAHPGAGGERYHIRGVVGPDEYHTAYPDRDEPGIDDNAYTNLLAAWVLARAPELLALLTPDDTRRVRDRVKLEDAELRAWERISRRLYVPFHGDRIISQFEGYDALEEFDWEGYRQRHGDIQRLDRILEAEGDTPNRYKASKQADVLMLFYLFSAEQLEELLGRLGYEYDGDLIPRNVEYYARRTSHGSTLSRVVHSWVLSRSDRPRAWSLFCDALSSDVQDIQGGTTHEGIHLGAMAGTVDLVRRCFAGVEIRDDALWIDPRLPDEMAHMRFRVRYHGHWIALSIGDGAVEVAPEAGWRTSLRVGFRGEVHTIEPGERVRLDLDGG